MSPRAFSSVGPCLQVSTGNVSKCFSTVGNGLPVYLLPVETGSLCLQMPHNVFKTNMTRIFDLNINTKIIKILKEAQKKIVVTLF